MNKKTSSRLLFYIFIIIGRSFVDSFTGVGLDIKDSENALYKPESCFLLLF